MGSSSNAKADKNDNNDVDDAINDYSERDNFYSFYPKKKRNIQSPNERNKNDDNKDKDESSNEEKEQSNDNNKNNKAQNDKKNDDIDKENSNKKSNSEYNDDNNDESSYKKSNSEYNDDNNDKSSYKKNKKNKNKNKKNINDTNPFKESTNEMDYYSKKLKSKNLKVNEENYKKLKYDYNNMFSEGGGGKIPEYKVYANLNNKKDKSKYWKRTEFNGVIIVEDLKDYFPKDISKEEIQELIFEAFGDSIVEDDDLIIPGQTASYNQVLELADYVFNYIKGNDTKFKNNKSLKKLNIKIDLVNLDKKLIKDKLYKGKDPTEKQIENSFKLYEGNAKDVKVLSIEYL